jgi:hypothetical protein
MMIDTSLPWRQSQTQLTTSAKASEAATAAWKTYASSTAGTKSPAKTTTIPTRTAPIKAASTSIYGARKQIHIDSTLLKYFYSSIAIDDRTVRPYQKWFFLARL